MKLENCKDFTDVFDAVVHYGADIKKAVRKASSKKIARGTKVVAGESEFKYLYKTYPEHRQTIDTLAGI
jgi:hypothetical protein